MHFEGELSYLTYVPCRSHRTGVDVIDVVLVERLSLVAVENVWQAWGIGKPEDAVSCSSVSTGIKRGKKSERTYDGSCLGAHTMAMLSGIMTWYPA